jgi:transcription-repair coupling factor (superfamily II helicase)
MNTLSFPALQKRIAASPSAAALLRAFKENHFPLEIDAAEGSFMGIIMASLYARQNGTFVAVVPGESEAAQLERDLETAGIPTARLPWWGTMPYREMAPLSAVFGERMGVLGNLVSGVSSVVIASERAFLTPLPPPEYIKSLLITLKVGGVIDTTALAKTLVAYGYTRTPGSSSTANLP